MIISFFCILPFHIFVNIMKKNKLLILLLFVLVHTSSTIAQKNAGIINYKLHFIDIPDEVKPFQKMLPIEQDVYFKDSILKERLFSLYGLTQTKWVNYYTKNISLFVDYNETKARVLIPMDEMEAVDIKYLNDTSTIYNGYQAKKAKITYSDGYAYDIWYTTEIPAHYSSEFKGLKGFPLIYESTMEGIPVIYSFNSINYKTLPLGFMDTPIGYQTMSLNEFYNSLQSGQ